MKAVLFFVSLCLAQVLGFRGPLLSSTNTPSRRVERPQRELELDLPEVSPAALLAAAPLLMASDAMASETFDQMSTLNTAFELPQHFINTVSFLIVGGLGPVLAFYFFFAGNKNQPGGARF
uniref:Uncharacterized protein n=1 Tax=Chromera velia CCMP2878 TaxID=1169474 RepID=A0A0G4FFJ9_9ALVE|mmetsp:Transcript_2964/g.6060  ORF Transcript_2964/g.6060 Transcript_2964/m.6060 type:complete len:121 (-) Transcript_2964:449-811(-)|eukprot:Cvel_3280.t1-p1 / transcript=Cvel_3280.t1 / gene=Cvel_3280 / organism=Chromera_velia_CCMP2878 / gene_product=hypothetical protein / transcript_product=hypothetical protein / location=Cvel_scaffold129:16358-16846(-) / protein_length=120 / sequence_SO=supercontig / SO=protein_coding / is_pseudo=false